jgi:hypothetical protein
VFWLCVHFVIVALLFFLLHFFAFLCLFGIADARLFFPDLPANTWQLHDGCVLGLLGTARKALNLHLASAKVSSDSFSSTLRVLV